MKKWPLINHTFILADCGCLLFTFVCRRWYPLLENGGGGSALVGESSFCPLFPEDVILSE